MAYGPCKNHDCLNHTLRVHTRNGFCEDCAAAIREAKTKYVGRTAIPDAEPFEEIEALPTPQQPQASPVLAREEVAALDEAAGQDHFAEPSKKAPDLPEDLDRPFVLAGIEFAPLHKRRQSGENYVALRTTSLGISTAAEAELGLKRYTHARYTVSLDGTAVAIKFLTEKKPGALCVNRSTGSMAISAQPLASKHPELIGKKAKLEATDVRDWFVARFGGEAA